MKRSTDKANEVLIVLLPGLHGTSGLFKDFIEKQPPEFQTLVIEYPHDQVHSYDALKRIILQKLPVNGNPVVLLGESYSSPLALFVAAQNPAGLIGVILVAGFVRPPGPHWARYLPWALGFQLVQPLYFLRSCLAGSRRRAQIIKQIASELRKVKPLILASRVREVLRVDATEAFRACAVPVLYIAGDSDHIVKEHNMQLLLSLRPGIQTCTLPAAHFVLLDAPERAWSEIGNFIHGQCA